MEDQPIRVMDMHAIVEEAGGKAVFVKTYVPLYGENRTEVYDGVVKMDADGNVITKQKITAREGYQFPPATLDFEAFHTKILDKVLSEVRAKIAMNPDPVISGFVSPRRLIPSCMNVRVTSLLGCRGGGATTVTTVTAATASEKATKTTMFLLSPSLPGSLSIRQVPIPYLCQGHLLLSSTSTPLLRRVWVSGRIGRLHGRLSRRLSGRLPRRRHRPLEYNNLEILVLFFNFYCSFFLSNNWFWNLDSFPFVNH